MRRYNVAPLLLPILAALAIVALTLYAYRDLPARPFAADDYQWLLNVRGLSFGEVMRKAFDPSAQTHFYRPLIWLLFWAQTHAFGLDPRGFHAVSLALHLLNALLLGWLAYRLMPKCKIENVKLKMPNPERFLTPQFSIFNSQFSIPLLAMAIVALHPAPFEAVVWISSQSELLAAALLLVMLHLWLVPKTKNQEPENQRTGEPRIEHRHSHLVILSSCHLVTGLLATLALGLALLAKESAVIGLPLLMLMGRTSEGRRQKAEGRRQGQASSIRHQASGTSHHIARRSIFNFQFSILNFIPPTLVTLAYVALQIGIERRNYLLAQGGYGIGPQLVLNPLRSLALIVAPLPGTEHADAAWLVPAGALVALLLLGWAIYYWRRQSTIYNLQSAMILALALTLLPTAPFASPPDSRYLYLPMMAAALLGGLTIDGRRWTMRDSPGSTHRLPSTVYRQGIVLCSSVVVLALASWASGELHAREGRFAAASGPGGSLWRVAAAACAEARPDRMVVVEPPVAAPHVEAIIGLACGPDVRVKVVGGDKIEGAIKGHTVVIIFPNGSAEVQRRT